MVLLPVTGSDRRGSVELSSRWLINSSVVAAQERVHIIVISFLASGSIFPRSKIYADLPPVPQFGTEAKSTPI